MAPQHGAVQYYPDNNAAEAQPAQNTVQTAPAAGYYAQNDAAPPYEPPVAGGYEMQNHPRTEGAAEGFAPPEGPPPNAKN